MSLVTHAIAPDADFLTEAARHILSFAQPAQGLDLSQCSLLLPNLKLAPALSRALHEGAGQPVLLPRIGTLSSLVEPWLTELSALPDSRRQLILHVLLKQRDWLEEGMLWDVVGELTQLFDALSEHAVGLPGDEAELVRSLERAFQLHDARALNFEARLVHALWRAEATGEPSLAVARLLAAGRWVDALQGPLIVLLEGEEAGPLQSLMERATQRVPVLCLQPRRVLAQGALAELLEIAWPAADTEQPLSERLSAGSAAMLAEARQRVKLVSAESLEDLGGAVAQQVLRWLDAGLRDIALVACDRLAARRARALLEREGVLVQDETGWKMVTTRVAAVVDAWLEVLATDGWHRALVDLLRAPLLFADLDPLRRAEGVAALERLIRDSGMADGLDALHGLAAERAPAALPLLDRLLAARARFNPGQSASISEWLRRLYDSLELLGAMPHFVADQAGRQWLEWLQMRQGELAAEGLRFRFAAWRIWFNRQMDAVLFRDESVDSPVIMTHLAAMRLRSFEAVILIGADNEHLAPAVAPGWLTHAGVRRELGLPGLEVERRRLREDLAMLILSSGESVLAWQSQQRDEARLPATDLAVLEATLRLMAGGSVVRQAEAQTCPAADLPGPTVRPSPVLAPQRVPTRLSASAMQALVDCPYRYFARHVLRIAEQEDLVEGMEKRDFGEALHRILLRFHQRFPRLLDVSDEATLIEALSDITEGVFAEAVARNFQDHAWRLRWRARLAAYVAWQREREVAGWQWQAGELELTREHELPGGRCLELQGRIDRLDVDAAGTQALLDYKSRALKPLRDQAQDADDVQLAFYALLQGERVSEAAYVALDGDALGCAPVEDPAARAAALRACIEETFSALLEGAGLPAQGTPTACGRCEMRGLCRQEWVA